MAKVECKSHFDQTKKKLLWVFWKIMTLKCWVQSMHYVYTHQLINIFHEWHATLFCVPIMVHFISRNCSNIKYTWTNIDLLFLSTCFEIWSGIGTGPVFYLWLNKVSANERPVDCELSMWGKIMIPMYRLWLHSLYGLYEPRCLLSPERLLNLITHSLTHSLS